MGINPGFSIGKWLNVTYQTNVADIKALTKENRRFYMIIPRRFILNSFIRFTLINFILAFFSFGYFLAAEIPTYAFACLRFHIFTKQMKTFGLSAKRLWICFVAEYLIFVVLCYFLRKQLFALM
ncbi:MAG: hypothetical protein IJU52_01585 [Clostridia bacterium]|nr:hypothetical protein [Clostridia bacterium]